MLSGPHTGVLIASPYGGLVRMPPQFGAVVRVEANHFLREQRHDLRLSIHGDQLR